MGLRRAHLYTHPAVVGFFFEGHVAWVLSLPPQNITSVSSSISWFFVFGPPPSKVPAQKKIPIFSGLFFERMRRLVLSGFFTLLSFGVYLR